MREIIDEIKYGFGVALSELLLFIVRIGCCVFYVGLPLLVSAIVPLLIGLLLSWCEAKYAFLIFKILFSLFQILALSISMSMVSSDEQVPESDPGRSFIPSKDLIIAIYVIINIYIWRFL